MGCRASKDVVVVVLGGVVFEDLCHFASAWSGCESEAELIGSFRFVI